MSINLTSLNCVLDPVAVSVVGAVPPVVAELVLTLDQPLSRTKGNRLNRLRPLCANILPEKTDGPEMVLSLDKHLLCFERSRDQYEMVIRLRFGMFRSTDVFR